MTAWKFLFPFHIAMPWPRHGMENHFLAWFSLSYCVSKQLGHMIGSTCYGLNCIPLKFIHWSPNPHVTVLEIMPLRRWLKSSEVIKVEFWSDRTSVIKKRGRNTRDLSLSLPCEDSVRRRPSASQEENSHQKLNPARTLLGLSSF